MAQSLELLTNRTGTMRSIRSIVSTMKTMSSINARPYEQAALAMGEYRKTVLKGFHAFVQCHGPLPADNDPDTTKVVIALGSDHGLCGNYNEIVAVKVKQVIALNTRVICVGAQMEDALIGQGITPEMTLLPPATADGLGRLSGRMITVLDDVRRASTTDSIAVSLVFMERVAHGQQQPVSQPILPLDPKLTATFAQTPWTSRSLPQFNMPPDRLLAALIRSYLFAEMFRAAAEALVTENAARLARMQQAEQSIDEQLQDLTSEMRSVRQSEITTELLDVIIGFEALKDRGKKKPQIPKDIRRVLPRQKPPSET